LQQTHVWSSSAFAFHGVKALNPGLASPSAVEKRLAGMTSEKLMGLPSLAGVAHAGKAAHFPGHARAQHGPAYRHGVRHAFGAIIGGFHVEMCR